MAKTITFNELRKIKDQLPSGSMRQIADKLDINEETVRNYFGGRNFVKGQTVGVHFEQGPDGGLVKFDDTTILDLAKKNMYYKPTWCNTNLIKNDPSEDTSLYLIGINKENKLVKYNFNGEKIIKKIGERK